MREIKFRVWDKITNKWLEGDYVYATITCLGNTFITAKGISRNSNDLILSQYTGLHDKNGRDIYDGDILVNKSIYQYFGNNPFAIEFNDGGFWSFCEEYPEPEEHEIIGNIYENKELLNAKA